MAGVNRTVNEWATMLIDLARGNSKHLPTQLDMFVQEYSHDAFGRSALFSVVPTPEISVIGGHHLLYEVARYDPGGCKNFSKSARMIRIIIKNGGHVDQRDRNRQTALHAAVYEDNLLGAQELLALGANPDILDSENKSPFSLCKEYSPSCHSCFIDFKNRQQDDFTDSEEESPVLQTLEIGLTEEVVGVGLALMETSAKEELIAAVMKVMEIKTLSAFGQELMDKIVNQVGGTRVEDLSSEILATEVGKVLQSQLEMVFDIIANETITVLGEEVSAEALVFERDLESQQRMEDLVGSAVKETEDMLIMEIYSDTLRVEEEQLAQLAVQIAEAKEFAECSELMQQMFTISFKEVIKENQLIFIQSDPFLWEYFVTLHQSLSSTVFACQAIASGLVANASQSTGEYLWGKVNEVVGMVSVMGLQLGTGLINCLLRTVNDYARHQYVKRITSLFKGCDFQKFLIQLAQEITITNRDTICRLGSEQSPSTGWEKLWEAVEWLRSFESKPRGVAALAIADAARLVDGWVKTDSVDSINSSDQLDAYVVSIVGESRSREELAAVRNGTWKDSTPSTAPITEVAVAKMQLVELSIKKRLKEELLEEQLKIQSGESDAATAGELQTQINQLKEEVEEMKCQLARQQAVALEAEQRVIKEREERASQQQRLNELEESHRLMLAMIGSLTLTGVSVETFHHNIEVYEPVESQENIAEVSEEPAVGVPGEPTESVADLLVTECATASVEIATAFVSGEEGSRKFPTAAVCCVLM